ncbi:response regulator [Pontibacillus salicampi]|uniref:Response regulator n=1 Tax=Pontibacillus salicampi TaxID=1449801 RepID=A0ABV6LRX5_9BACI
MRVFIAEDDYRVANLHETFLKSIEGIEVVGKALNAQTTLDSLKDLQVDLLLLDVYMPDQLGTDILPIMRERHPAVDIIMITAADDKQQVEKAIRFGVVDYMIKPITMERFMETIERFHHNFQAKQHVKQYDQQFVDQLLGKVQESQEEKQHLPKGIDEYTLHKVKDSLREFSRGITAEEFSYHMGASKTTARRYLEFLTTEGKALAETEFGKVGRPQRKYYAK